MRVGTPGLVALSFDAELATWSAIAFSERRA